jgi:uncharacterized membrane protein
MGDVTLTERYFNELRAARAAAGTIYPESAYPLARVGAGLAGDALTNDTNGITSAGTGLAVAFLGTSESITTMETLKAHYWLAPLLVILLGYWMKKKGKVFGGPLMAVGATMFVYAYRAYRKDEDAKEAAAAAKKKAAGGAETSGPDDTDRGWWRAPSGEWMLVPMQQLRSLPGNQGAGMGDPSVNMAERIYSSASMGG